MRLARAIAGMVLSAVVACALPGVAIAAPATAAKPAASANDHRIALVIGNDNYQGASRLDRAVADAAAVKEQLSKLGFTVYYHANATRRDLNDALDDFVSRLSTDTVAVIFYAGHGVEVEGENYLLPIDLDARKERDIKNDAINLPAQLKRMSTLGAKFMLAVIDACRDNPFAAAPDAIAARSFVSTRSLSPTPATATGVMVVYSAGNGQSALDSLGPNDKDPNGLFTREFVKAMKKPGLTVLEVMTEVKDAVTAGANSVGQKQTPALYDQSVGKFYFIEEDPEEKARQEAARARESALAEKAIEEARAAKARADLAELQLREAEERMKQLEREREIARQTADIEMKQREARIRELEAKAEEESQAAKAKRLADAAAAEAEAKRIADLEKQRLAREEEARLMAEREQQKKEAEAQRIAGIEQSRQEAEARKNAEIAQRQQAEEAKRLAEAESLKKAAEAKRVADDLARQQEAAAKEAERQKEKLAADNAKAANDAKEAKTKSEQAAVTAATRVLERYLDARRLTADSLKSAKAEAAKLDENLAKPILATFSQRALDKLRAQQPENLADNKLIAAHNELIEAAASLWPEQEEFIGYKLEFAKTVVSAASKVGKEQVLAIVESVGRVLSEPKLSPSTFSRAEQQIEKARSLTYGPAEIESALTRLQSPVLDRLRQQRPEDLSDSSKSARYLAMIAAAHRIWPNDGDLVQYSEQFSRDAAAAERAAREIAARAELATPAVARRPIATP